MLFAFYMGSRREQEKIFFDTNGKVEPESMDAFQEPTEEEYMKSINAWKQNDGETESDQ